MLNNSTAFKSYSKFPPGGREPAAMVPLCTGDWKVLGNTEAVNKPIFSFDFPNHLSLKLRIELQPTDESPLKIEPEPKRKEGLSKSVLAEVKS